MSIFIGYRSALEYWRGHTRSARVSGARGALATQADAASAPTLPERPPIAADIPWNVLRDLGITGAPLHVIAAGRSFRKPEESVRTHTLRKAPPFVEVAPGLHVATPEACFLQEAQTRSLAELAALGCELCGTYAVASDSPHFTRPLRPRISVADLTSFIGGAPAQPGLANARRALAHLVDRSASRGQTAFILLLCLPTAQGGFGLPKPQANDPIRIKDPSRGPRVMRRTLCWPELGFAIALAGREDHKAHAQRVLAGRPVHDPGTTAHLMIVPSALVHDADDFALLARNVALCLGKPLRITRKDFAERQAALRRALLLG